MWRADANPFSSLRRVLARIDGLLTFDSAVYNPEVTTALPEWFGETGRKVYHVGPLFPSVLRLISRVVGREGNRDGGKEVLAFLDKQLAEHGENLVIYVRRVRVILYIHWLMRGMFIGLVWADVLAAGGEEHPIRVCST